MRDAGDWAGWITFFLDSVIEVSQQATETAAILRMRDYYRTRITEHLGRAAANGQRVMDRLFDYPIVTVATVRKWRGITLASANQIVARLERIGLLREITGYARNRALSLRAVFAAVRGEWGGGTMNTKASTAMSCERQLDAAMVTNMKEFGVWRRKGFCARSPASTRGDTCRPTGPFTPTTIPTLRQTPFFVKPPFNMNRWGGEHPREDRCWQFGVPSQGVSVCPAGGGR